jgi:RND family efflux transporter MFP subunit
LDPGALVESIKVRSGSHLVIVRGTGTVQAAQVVSIIPQVSGRITSMPPALVSGGFFRKDEPLFEIDRTDYRLALAQAEAAKARAEYDLARMESQAQVARKEWESINTGAEPNPLVVYEPQMKDARASLKSAEAAVERARVDLDRTRVLVPFNSRVSSEEIDLGQYVRAGSPVAMLAGTDTAEIVVPLPLDELHWVRIPRGPGGKGAKADVVMKIGGQRFVWKGVVVRSLGEVGLKDRMMQVVVSVADPYGLKNMATGEVEGKPALAVGTFVDVVLEGKRLGRAFSIPRRALRDDSTVWMVDNENKLRIKKVVTARIEHDSVIVTGGLTDGDTVVVTPLSGAADGMKLRPVIEGGQGPADEGGRI